jgi:hypothetical protein
VRTLLKLLGSKRAISQQQVLRYGAKSCWKLSGILRESANSCLKHKKGLAFASPGGALRNSIGSLVLFLRSAAGERCRADDCFPGETLSDA